MSTYTDEQLQQLIPFMEKLAEYNCGYDLSKALMVEVLHLRNLLREVCDDVVVDYGDTPNGGYVICQLCDGICDYETGELTRAPDCPVGIAKKFLG